jgi:CDP-diacylglycerol---glycerol-3-phosphate 3-phosphatidyltransferase
VQINTSHRYDGPMGKSDRAFVFGSTGFLIAFGLLGPAGLLFVFAVVGLLLCLTIWNRCRKALQEVATHGA